jgi:hypothetical protein
MWWLIRIGLSIVISVILLTIIGVKGGPIQYMGGAVPIMLVIVMLEWSLFR